MPRARSASDAIHATPDSRTLIDELRGVGAARAALLHGHGIHRFIDLLRLAPRRHLRFPAPQPIASLQDGIAACIRVRVRKRVGSGRRGVVATRLTVEDVSGTLLALVFGPSYLVRSFRTGEIVELVGRASARGPRPAFLVQAILHEEDLPDDGCAAWLPVYDLPEGIPPRLHRRWVRAALARCAVELGTRFRALHFPRSDEELAEAERAFALERAVHLQRRLRRLRRLRPERPAGPYAEVDVDRWLVEFRGALPYRLTGDQERALADVASDLCGPRMMVRLLTGDVGSGKTAVALFPLLVAARAGRQAALLAPTEILARQHAATLAPLLARLALPLAQLVVAGETGPRAGVAAPLVVGTHRLLGRSLRFRDLAAVVVDEQHKFGVRQRFSLWAKGREPDLLLVSATPIPRTLAHTWFGHLDLSVLAERPFAARNVTTELLVSAARRDVPPRIAAELARGGRVFVVCPAIHDRADPVAAGLPPGGSTAPALPSVEKVAPWLRARLPRSAVVATLHGEVAPEEKRSLLDRFARGEVQVLVATVVVEVGIDIPDATLAVVLGAERFGLAQLHQIRGRVGRRGQPAACLLVSADPSEAAHARLASFAAIDDGFALAELDLQQRGPGQLLGTRQHGREPFLARLLADPELLETARRLVDAEEAALAAGRQAAGRPQQSATTPRDGRGGTLALDPVADGADGGGLG